MDLIEHREYIDDGNRMVKMGRTYQWIGNASIAIGAMALGTAAAMFFLDISGNEVSAAVMPTAGAGAVATFATALP
jgi:hypothetical protein